MDPDQPGAEKPPVYTETCSHGHILSPADLEFGVLEEKGVTEENSHSRAFSSWDTCDTRPQFCCVVSEYL